jgi:hypothetical protein
LKVSERKSNRQVSLGLFNRSLPCQFDAVFHEMNAKTRKSVAFNPISIVVFELKYFETRKFRLVRNASSELLLFFRHWTQIEANCPQPTTLLYWQSLTFSLSLSSSLSSSLPPKSMVIESTLHFHLYISRFSAPAPNSLVRSSTSTLSLVAHSNALYTNSLACYSPNTKSASVITSFCDVQTFRTQAESCIAIAMTNLLLRKFNDDFLLLSASSADVDLLATSSDLLVFNSRSVCTRLDTRRFSLDTFRLVFAVSLVIVASALSLTLS